MKHASEVRGPIDDCCAWLADDVLPLGLGLAGPLVNDQLGLLGVVPCDHRRTLLILHVLSQLHHVFVRQIVVLEVVVLSQFNIPLIDYLFMILLVLSEGIKLLEESGGHRHSFRPLTCREHSLLLLEIENSCVVLSHSGLITSRYCFLSQLRR